MKMNIIISAIVSAFAIASMFSCVNNNSHVETDAETIADSSAVNSAPLLRINHVNGLTIYNITHHIVFSTKPIKNDFVELISSAAFTDVCGRIVGHYYITPDGYGRNPKDRNVTGGFIKRPYNGTTKQTWDFYASGYEAELASAAKSGNVISAFVQNVIIYKGVTQDTAWRRNDVFQYRALCEMDGELKIIESDVPIPYNEFVEALAALHVCNALYLDMGTYNYLWYDIDVTSEDTTIVGKTVEVKCANYNKISNFINVWIAD